MLCCRSRFLCTAAAIGVGVLALAGCALPQNEMPGATLQEVHSRLGPATVRHALPEGERHVYSEMPAGSAAYQMDFDASGRLVRNEQVLTQSRFEQLTTRLWHSSEVLASFGPPLRVERVARFHGEIWSYRFRQNADLRQAHVHIDPEGVVRQLAFTDELPSVDNAYD